MTKEKPKLSLSEARRIALAAQGFDRARPGGAVTARHMRRTIHQMGLLQIDYVNVVVPSQYQVLYSRLGPYERSRLDDLVYRGGEFTEQWAHEASIVPLETWPLLRHRMEQHRVRPYNFAPFLDQHSDYVDWVLDQVRARGPLAADDLQSPEGAGEWLAESWYGSVPRAVLEAHFGRGLLAVADRRSNFSRVFDLVERLIPADQHERKVEREDAQRELLRLSARACGVATAADLADYFRMPVRDAHPRIAELLEAGDLREVLVEGWRERAFLFRGVKAPARIDAAALLSPFDPVVWYRKRTARLFGFDFRFEIFLPAEKRKWGCYVLPFLLGDKLVARVDLKADRARGRLLVLGAYLEEGQDAGEVAAA
ncbi:MAG: winged helix DNA-binding domain-containing protein, partial [Acidobacteriota bacterium]|nr:winged helix DNA-binding domain-containing protein [Acidobacteriota bacterium]